MPDREMPNPLSRPLQLSPQRMQEIGVTSATVEMKDVSDNLSVPGNVDIDEERLSYVQTRFSGWIQDVSANATYQYVRKGQRLFTVYSPDLVSSEQEYLLARQNKSAFSQDAHGMGTQDDGWLLKAAEERLQQFGVPAQTIADLDQTGKVQRNIRRRLTSLGLHYRAQRSAERLCATGYEVIHHRRSLHGVGLRQCISKRRRQAAARRPGTGDGGCLSGTPLQRPHRSDSAAGGYDDAHRARAPGSSVIPA